MGLCLKRKLGETITIGPDVTVTVDRISGDKVLLRIEAPQSVAVHRLEVFKEIEKRAAASRVGATPDADPGQPAGERDGGASVQAGPGSLLSPGAA